MKVFFYGDVLEYTNGDKSFDLAGDKNGDFNLQALIDILSSHYGKRFHDFIHGGETCFFLVNGRGIMMTGGLSTKLGPEDRVEILPFAKAG
jgi:molybdopterin converting factor small subunit